MNVISSAYAGMTDAMARFGRAANDEVAAFTTGEGDAAAAIVEQIQARAQFRAGASVVRVADEMMASLLDLQRNRP